MDIFQMRTPRNTSQYDSIMRMRISLAVAFLLARFRRFFCCSFGLTNHLNPYAVQESYLNGMSYSKNESKKDVER